MFGMGGSEIIVILVIALIFLGPEKLPDAAKSISKGIRDLRGATKEISQTIENDEQIGGALRDIKSALRGEEIQARPKPRLPKKPPQLAPAAAAPAVAATTAEAAPAPAADVADAEPDAGPRVTLAATVGEVEDEAAAAASADDGSTLAAFIRPATGAIGRGAEPAVAASAPDTAKPDHG